MARLLAPLLTALALAIAPSAAVAAPQGFAERVEELRQDGGIPGIALAIVENGEPVLVRGFGQRGLEDARAVDEHTLFMTGSTGKAMTAAALALLVDQGRIAWDDRVIDHLPWFRLFDPYATREITIRDLMVHRSGLGLGAGDLLGVPRGSLSRRESVRRLAFVRPAYSFRQEYRYDNVLYMVAGQLIEEVTGQTWEDFVTRHVFRAGGMMDSVTDDASRLASSNRALPHARLGGPVRGAGEQTPLDERDQLGANMAPAGAQALSAADLGRWLQFQLGEGALPDGTRLWSAAQAAEMHQPVVVQKIGAVPDWMRPIAPSFQSYALGWEVRDYRGEKMVWHSGGVFGYGAIVVLLPEREVGFAIAINSEDGWVVRALMYELLDHYLGIEDSDWATPYQAFAASRIAAAVDFLAQPEAAPAQVGPSLPLSAYAGTYRDAWYGDVVVSERDGGLWINFTTTPRMEGPLEHYQYDTFRTRLTDSAIEPALVTFQLTARGAIDRVSMVAASPIADFSYDYHDLDLRPVENAR